MKRLAGKKFYFNDLSQEAQEVAFNEFYYNLYWSVGREQLGMDIETYLDNYNSSFYDDTDVTYVIDKGFGGEIDDLTILDGANCYTSEEEAFTEGTWQNAIYQMCESDINPVGYNSIEDYESWISKLVETYNGKLDKHEYERLLNATYRIVSWVNKNYFEEIYASIIGQVEDYDDADDRYIYYCLINYEGQNGPIFNEDGTLDK